MQRSVSYKWVQAAALALYAFAIWLHLPYGGGHVYSDIVSVFQIRECPSGCTLPIPYAQGFVEYPPLTAFFMYVMAAAASFLPLQLLLGYYVLSVLALLIPTLLLVRELHLIGVTRGFDDSRILWFFVATPAFVFALLVNWYVIGTLFAVAGIRYGLQGRGKLSGALFGLSAASNLVTAVPLLGLLLAGDDVKREVVSLLSAVSAWAAISLPVYLLNPGNWWAFWAYHYNWYIEDSWMNLMLDNTSNLRHLLPLICFGALLCGILVVRLKFGMRDPVRLAFIATLGMVFSNYVYTPQMNVLILPFLVMISPAAFYPGFLLFDSMNAFVVIGFSQTLQVLGLPSLASFQRFSPVQLAGSLRSLWAGKFAAYDGILKIWKIDRSGRPGRQAAFTVRSHRGPYVPVSSLSLEDMASEPPADSPTT